jgi:hypothetical protein
MMASYLGRISCGFYVFLGIATNATGKLLIGTSRMVQEPALSPEERIRNPTNHPAGRTLLSFLRDAVSDDEKEACCHCRRGTVDIRSINLVAGQADERLR